MLTEKNEPQDRHFIRLEVGKMLLQVLSLRMFIDADAMVCTAVSGARRLLRRRPVGGDALKLADAPVGLDGGSLAADLALKLAVRGALAAVHQPVVVPEPFLTVSKASPLDP